MRWSRQSVLTKTIGLGKFRTMDETSDADSSQQRRQRVVERAEQMVRSGRLTDQEAEGLRSAREPAEFDDAIRNIRVRHAGARLGPAVAAGSLTREEADSFLDRLRKGEHSSALRAQLRKLRTGRRAEVLERPEDDGSSA